MAADCFISLSKNLPFFCQLFSRVDLIIMFNFFSLEKMVDSQVFILTTFFSFYYFRNTFNFPSLILRNGGCFLTFMFSFEILCTKLAHGRPELIHLQLLHF